MSYDNTVHNIAEESQTMRGDTRIAANNLYCQKYS